MVRQVLFGAVLTVGVTALSASAAEQLQADTTSPSKVERKVVVEPPTSPDGPAKVRTQAATFEVNPNNVDLLRRAIAGEDVGQTIYAGGVEE